MFVNSLIHRSSGMYSLLSVEYLIKLKDNSPISFIMVFVLKSLPKHTPIKCRFMVKKRNQIRLAYHICQLPYITFIIDLVLMVQHVKMCTQSLHAIRFLGGAIVQIHDINITLSRPQFPSPGIQNRCNNNQCVEMTF